MTNAIDSFYGKGHSDAIRTRECVAMPGLRNQTVITPPHYLDRVRDVLDGIALDPCSSGDDHVDAATRYVWPEQDGLSLPWVEGTFYNPPYGKLKDWLRKRAAERANGVDELIGLLPLRPHRKWFDLEAFDLVCFMDPFKFDGYKQAFPAPLVTVYDGKRAHRFRDAFSDYGRVRRVTK